MIHYTIRFSAIILVLLFSSISFSIATPPACSAEVGMQGGTLIGTDTMVVCVNMPIQFEDQSLLEGLLSVRTWNFGDGSGAVDGLLSTVTSYAYSLEGTYTMSLTVDALLCTEMTVTKTIIVLGQPQFTTNTAHVNCAGNCNGKASVSVIGLNASYYNVYWDDPQFQINDTAFNLCAGSYHGIISDDFGCTDLMTNPVDVFEPQPLVASIDAGDTLDLCPANGITAIQLTINGGVGNNQSIWTISANISVPSPNLMNFNPTEESLNQLYSVTVMDNNGCQALDSIYIRAASSSLEGMVVMEGSPCAGCKVIRYHTHADPGVWSEIENELTDASGYFNFGVINNFEEFVLMADPEEVAFPMGVETFYPQEYNWSNATTFNMCGNNYYKTIALIPPMNFNGTNTLSGTVFYSATGKTQTDEDPIPLIDVVVEKTPPGSAQGRVATNGSGEFTFEYVPNSDTTYTLFVNIPGVPVTSTYEILANGGSQLFSGLDFCLNIDSTEINICHVEESLVTSEPQESDGQQFRLYPNPNNGMFVIETGKFAESASEIRIIDPAGRMVFRKSYGETPFTINMVNVAEGYYLVQILNDKATDSSPISVMRY